MLLRPILLKEFPHNSFNILLISNVSFIWNMYIIFIIKINLQNIQIHNEYLKKKNFNITQNIFILFTINKFLC